MAAPRSRRDQPTDQAYADTNLFVALLAGPAHPLHAAALGLFRRVAEGTLGLLVTPIVVAELVYVTRALFSWTSAVAAVRLAAMLEADGVILTDPSTTLRALRLLAERPRLDFADAWLAAAALEVGPAVIASFDRDFDGLPGVVRLST